MNKHINPSDEILWIRIFPRKTKIEGEFNWGSDWVKWCERNCKGKFAHDHISRPEFRVFFLFENTNDAFAFRMIWG